MQLSTTACADQHGRCWGDRVLECWWWHRWKLFIKLQLEISLAKVQFSKDLATSEGEQRSLAWARGIGLLVLDWRLPCSLRRFGNCHLSSVLPQWELPSHCGPLTWHCFPGSSVRFLSNDNFYAKDTGCGLWNFEVASGFTWRVARCGSTVPIQSSKTALCWSRTKFSIFRQSACTWAILLQVFQPITPKYSGTTAFHNN